MNVYSPPTTKCVVYLFPLSLTPSAKQVRVGRWGGNAACSH